MMRTPPPRARMQRRWFVLGGIVLVLFISISSIVRFYTDLLWFDELDFTNDLLEDPVDAGRPSGSSAASSPGLIVLANLEIARRAAPRYRFAARRDGHRRAVPVGVPSIRAAGEHRHRASIALFTGLSTSAMWERFLLWRNACRSAFARRNLSGTTSRTTSSRSRSSGRSCRGCSVSRRVAAARRRRTPLQRLNPARGQPDPRRRLP